MNRNSRFLAALIAGFFLALLWSAISPHDYFTWFLEVLPALLYLAVLTATYKRFPLTRITYFLIFVHSLILMVGGHYTYAEVPLFNWIKDAFDLGRNHYDRLGHFAQGFIPAIIAREILLRKSPLKKGGWLFFIVVCICLAISAFYEFIEWWAAVLTGTRAEAFLGSQGDIWDSQWDMFLAMCGSITALITMGRLHDRALRKLLKSESGLGKAS